MVKCPECRMFTLESNQHESGSQCTNCGYAPPQAPLRLCYFCEDPLEPAPTNRPWLEFNVTGMHRDCIDKLKDTSDFTKTAPVLGESVLVSKTKRKSQSFKLFGEERKQLFTHLCLWMDKGRLKEAVIKIEYSPPHYQGDKHRWGVTAEEGNETQGDAKARIQLLEGQRDKLVKAVRNAAWFIAKPQRRGDVNEDQLLDTLGNLLDEIAENQ